MKLKNIEEIIEKIKQEREKQIEQWGNDFDDTNTAHDWTSYVCHYATEASWNPWDEEKFEKNMLKAASVAIAALQSLYRNNWKIIKRSYSEIPKSKEKLKLSKKAISIYEKQLKN